MIHSSTNTESKIFLAACITFLKYGYHGTTLLQIAKKAKINKASVHYYFRSKKWLYFKVVENVLSTLTVDSKIEKVETNQIDKEIIWFLYTELYNNRIVFEEALLNNFYKDWEEKLSEVEKWLNDNLFN